VTATTEILIGDANGEHVVMNVLSRRSPGLFDHWDGNWLACELQISVGGFRAAFRADLRSEEFLTFLGEVEALSRALDGAATFFTIEEQIRLTLTADGLGHIRVQGEARDLPGSDNHLHFAFDIDQTYLPQICRSVEVVLAAFPVVGSADA
jgi:hypothetical protein